jgi:SulP family sulfate permease
MTAIDATGLRALEDLATASTRTDRTLILCGARSQPARLMAQAEFDEHIGHGNICAKRAGGARPGAGAAGRTCAGLTWPR